MVQLWQLWLEKKCCYFEYRKDGSQEWYQTFRRRTCGKFNRRHLNLLFNRGLELSLRFGQFFPQTFALLRAPLQLLLKLLQTCHGLPVSLILLMEKKPNTTSDARPTHCDPNTIGNNQNMLNMLHQKTENCIAKWNEAQMADFQCQSKAKNVLNSR